MNTIDTTAGYTSALTTRIDGLQDWMYRANPVATREILLLLRGSRAFVILTVIPLVGSIAALFALTSIGTGAGGISSAQNWGNRLFHFYVWVLFVATSLIAPALSSGSICTERANGSLDFLRVTPLSDAQVFLAKLSASLYLIGLTLLTTLPILICWQILGGFSVGDIISASSIIVASSLLGSCMGLVASSFISRLDLAVVMTYMGLLGFFFLGMGLQASLDPIAGTWVNDLSAILSPPLALIAILRPGTPPTVTYGEYTLPLWVAASGFVVLLSVILFFIGAWRLDKEPVVLTRLFRWSRRRTRARGTNVILFKGQTNPVFLRDFQCGFFAGSWMRVLIGSLLLTMPAFFLMRYWPGAPSAFGMLYFIISLPIVVSLGATAIAVLRDKGLLTQAILSGMTSKQILMGKASSCLLMALPFLISAALCLILEGIARGMGPQTFGPGMGPNAFARGLPAGDPVTSVIMIIVLAMLALVQSSFLVIGALGFLSFWAALALSRSIREPSMGRALTSTIVQGLIYTMIGSVLASCVAVPFSAFSGGPPLMLLTSGLLSFHWVGTAILSFIWAALWYRLGARYLDDTSRLMDRMVERYDFASG